MLARSDTAHRARHLGNSSPHLRPHAHMFVLSRARSGPDRAPAPHCARCRSRGSRVMRDQPHRLAAYTCRTRSCRRATTGHVRHGRPAGAGWRAAEQVAAVRMLLTVCGGLAQPRPPRLTH